jgi:hypothetical protein
VVADAHAVRFASGDAGREQLPAGGWEQAVVWAFADARREVVADTAARSTSVVQGQGLARLMLQALREAVSRAGIATLVAPTRPVAKAREPGTPMARYAALRTRKIIRYAVHILTPLGEQALCRRRVKMTPWRRLGVSFHPPLTPWPRLDHRRPTGGGATLTDGAHVAASSCRARVLPGHQSCRAGPLGGPPRMERTHPRRRGHTPAITMSPLSDGSPRRAAVRGRDRC